MTKTKLLQNFVRIYIYTSLVYYFRVMQHGAICFKDRKTNNKNTKLLIQSQFN